MISGASSAAESQFFDAMQITLANDADHRLSASTTTIT
jgi:hypothetical protein